MPDGRGARLVVLASDEPRPLLVTILAACGTRERALAELLAEEQRRRTARQRARRPA